MVIPDEFAQLSAAANQLNKIAERLAEDIDAVNRTLRDSAAPGSHTYGMPLSEVSYEGDGGREIVLTFMVFAPISGLRQLGVVQKRVFESRLQGQRDQTRQVMTPLTAADLGVQRKAIMHLADFANQIRTDGQQASDVDELFDEAPTRLVHIDPSQRKA